MNLRLATSADATAIQSIYAPVVRETTISFEWDAPTVAEIASRIDATLANGYPWLVGEIDRQVVAYAYAGRFRTRAAYDWTAEVSVYVDRGRHRSGAGRAIYGELLRVLERQGFRSAFGVMTVPNAASEGLHRALGFVEVGRFPRVGWKFGAWHDVSVWRVALGEDRPPAQLRSVVEALNDPS